MIRKFLDGWAKKRVSKIINAELMNELEALTMSFNDTIYKTDKGIILIKWDQSVKSKRLESFRSSGSNYLNVLKRRVINNIQKSWFVPDKNVIVENGQFVNQDGI